MNYIALANRYWNLHGEQAFQPGESHLYWCLLNLFSGKGQKANWPESIRLTDPALATAASINVKTVDKTRVLLEKRGLILTVSDGPGSRFGRTYWLVDEHGNYPLTCPKNGEVGGLTSPKKGEVEGEVNGQPPHEPPPQPLQKMDAIVERLPIYIEYQTRNNETETFINKKRGQPILEIEVEEIGLDAEPVEEKKEENPPFRAPPFPADRRLADEDRLELTHYTGLLQTNGRLLFKLSSMNGLKGDHALTWIEAFVADQWAAKNLTTRNQTELTMHCQRWIHDQLTKQKDREQRQQSTNRHSAPGNTRQSAGRQSSRDGGTAETGAELDRLAQQYFGC